MNMSKKTVKNILCDERIMLYAIVLNTAVMFIGGFWPDSIMFELSDALFTLLFLCEAIAKILEYGWKGYWKNGWNKVDFIVLVQARFSSKRQQRVQFSHYGP